MVHKMIGDVEFCHTLGGHGRSKPLLTAETVFIGGN